MYEVIGIIYAVAILITILILFSMTYLKINFIFHRLNEDDNIQINLSFLFDMIKLKYKIPYADIILSKKKAPAIKVGKAEKGHKKLKGIVDLKGLTENYKKYRKAIVFLSSKAHVEYIKWHTELGAGDAAITAIAVGLLYGIKGNILSFLFKPENADISVKPNYSKPIFEIDFNCIIKIKIANIIIAGIKLGKIFLTYFFKRRSEINNGRTSDSRADENYDG